MGTLPNEVWFAIALLTGGCVLGGLHTLAAQANYATKVHDLRVRVGKLQDAYSAHLEEIAERDGIVLNEVPLKALKSGRHAA